MKAIQPWLVPIVAAGACTFAAVRVAGAPLVSTYGVATGPCSTWTPSTQSVCAPALTRLSLMARDVWVSVVAV